MFGFGKKKKSKENTGSTLPANATFTVIPEVFYGGADPVIHYASVSPQRTTHRSRFTDPKFFLAAGGALFIILLLAAAVWYLAPARFGFTDTATPPPVSAPPSRPPSVSEPKTPVSIPLDITTTTKQPETPDDPPAASTGVQPERLGEWPRLNLLDSSDIDEDELTDKEEEIFATDSGSSDTDLDGYYDGLEVINLYNPKGSTPVKIIDSGTVREYVNARWQYRIYYPSAWQSAMVDANEDQVIFSAPGGDFVEVRALPKPSGQPFDSWFAETINGQRFGDLAKHANRFEVQGFERKDHLVAYYPADIVVFAVLYHPQSPGPVDFRRVMIMMTNSFRLGRITSEVPPQIPLPAEGTTTTENE
ncbi:MAG: hypothetical protein AAB408_02030 [Patescibacteria group bacterium]